MRYLFSTITEMSEVEQAPEGEPVIPCFPCYTPSFIAIPSFKHCVLAEVKRIPDSAQGFFDLLIDKITKQYTGIPASIIEAYIVGVARAASQFREGIKLRIFVTPETVSVQNPVTEEIFYLWKEHPKTKEH
ncbi:hypothetical protein ACFLQL_00690 [Verrucomicrobiota bacterium]